MDWVPFSPRGMKSILEANARINLWTGAVRSTKSICADVRWIEYVPTAPQGNLLVVGKTERTLRHNVLDVLQEIVNPGDLTFNTGLGEATLFGRKLLCVGANDERAENKIRGVTVAGVLGDEVSLWPESFFIMSLSRMSVPGAKGFFTTNADAPTHWLKTGFVDRSDQLDMRVFDGFQLEDNYSLDPAFVQALKREYVGLWHDRYIRGLWCIAEGAVYDVLGTKDCVAAVLPNIVKTWVGMDYGPGSVSTFWLLGLGDDCRLYFIDRLRWDVAVEQSQLSDPQLLEKLEAWLERIKVTPDLLIVPHDALSFARHVQVCRTTRGLRRIRSVAWADQSSGSVLEGIQQCYTLFSVGMLRFGPAITQDMLAEWLGYRWNPQARGTEVVKESDHDPDAGRYAVIGARAAWYPFLQQMLRDVETDR